MSGPPFALAGNEDLPLLAGQDAWFRLGGEWSVEDCEKPYSGLRAVLFGFVVRHVVRISQLAEPGLACGHYPSDLWHDARALAEYTMPQLVTGFRLQADGWGTWLFPLDHTLSDRKWSWVFRVYAHAPHGREYADWFLNVRCERAPSPTSLPGWMQVSV